MKILILNQAFHPDVVATAQHASDLAIALSREGHDVSVVCSVRGYADRKLRFPRRENWNGIQVFRVWSPGLGKSRKWTRALDFAVFMAACAIRILLLSQFDVVIALTSPPLISFLAALAVPLRAKRLVFWSMDLNPDEAIAAGWLRDGSYTSRLLSWMMRYSLFRAERIIALDRFMKERIVAKGIAEHRISVLPPWSHDQHVRFDCEGRESFRAAHDLKDKFVVMYSGNHSPCHPLDSVVAAAEHLSNREDIIFCFVGGGSEFHKISKWAEARNAKNIICLPYQPIDNLSASLSAADLHVVVMGSKYVGIVHPCKVYNILAVSKPFLYIGPRGSHVCDIMSEMTQLRMDTYSASTDCIPEVVAAILRAQHRSTTPASSTQQVAQRFSQASLMPEMLRFIEKAAANDPLRGRAALVDPNLTAHP
jgi:colanic acid biosynthesis glycosyl transferase WcaI